MRFTRYSAVESFGIPIDNPESLSEPSVITSLVAAYGIEPGEVPAEATDITPYYWEHPRFRYIVSMPHPDGPVIVDMLPVAVDSESYLLQSFGPLRALTQGIRHIEIPTHQEIVAIAGPGPRFIGKICIHEVLMQEE